MEAKRERRRNKTLQESSSQSGASLTASGEDIPTISDVPPWEELYHPIGTAPPQDDSFTIEDESTTSTVDSLLQTYVVRDVLAHGSPLVYVSAGYEALMGYRGSEVVGRPNNIMQEYRLPSPAAAADLASSISAKKVVDVEVQCLKRDNKPTCLQITIVPICDSDDTAHKTFEVIQELDEKARDNRASEDRQGVKWAELVKHHLHSFMIVGFPSSGPVINVVSSGFEGMLGYSNEECRGLSAAMITTLMASKHSIKELMHKLLMETAGSMKLLCYRKNGTPFWSRIHICPLVTDTKQEALCIIVDITSSRQKRAGKYILGKIIGQGSFGTVRKGKNTQTDELVAVKAISASKFKTISEIDQIQEEVSVLSNMKHPHIIRLLDAFFLADTFYVIMELGTHGSLASYIYGQPNRCLTEAEAGRILGQMASALEYCHRRRVAHRDLKPENVLMDEEKNVKIVDFGLAAVSKPFASSLSTQCGTPEFSAPEIIAGKEYQGEQVDVWSVGVMLYEMLTGTLPFRGDSRADLYKAIQRGQYDPLPPYISRACKDLVRHILTVEPALRCTLDDLIQHPWMQEIRSQQARHSREMVVESQEGGMGLMGSEDEDREQPETAEQMDYLDSSELVDASMVDRPEDDGMHDSVRLVIPSSGHDDPIMAAILSRTQLEGGRALSTAACGPTSPNSITGAGDDANFALRANTVGYDSVAMRAFKSNSSTSRRPGSKSNLPPLSVGGQGRFNSSSMSSKSPVKPRSMKSSFAVMESKQDDGLNGTGGRRDASSKSTPASLPPIASNQKGRTLSTTLKW